MTLFHSRKNRSNKNFIELFKIVFRLMNLMNEFKIHNNEFIKIVWI